MKKVLVIVTLALVFVGFVATTVSAGGDKVRGDKSVGDSHQVQNQKPQCWDEPWCTPTE